MWATHIKRTWEHWVPAFFKALGLAMMAGASSTCESATTHMSTGTLFAGVTCIILVDTFKLLIPVVRTVLNGNRCMPIFILKAYGRMSTGDDGIELEFKDEESSTADTERTASPVVPIMPFEQLICNIMSCMCAAMAWTMLALVVYTTRTMCGLPTSISFYFGSASIVFTGACRVSKHLRGS